VPPETSCDLIECRYVLNANVKYGGCTCSENPSISVPLTIIPRGNPAVYGFMEPPGYAPQYFPMVGFVLPGATPGMMLPDVVNETQVTTVHGGMPHHGQIVPHHEVVEEHHEVVEVVEEHYD
jgi:hypothetical protein